MKKTIKKIYEYCTHLIGKLTGKYYFEDHIRVYPDGIAYNRWGKQRQSSEDEVKNYTNHRKFYNFASQFVIGKKVADIGCGSGYGCEMIKNAGASEVYGYDISESSIKFAKSKYGNMANFAVAGITDLGKVKPAFFEIVTCSEVMEHIKEYGMEQKAVEELKKITTKNGLIIIATPNTELLHNHGYSYAEIEKLVKDNFKKYLIFENALYPISGKYNEIWEERKKRNSMGTIISEAINLDETAYIDKSNIGIKKGIEPGLLQLENYAINTNLLHNTHSWVVLAINE